MKTIQLLIALLLVFAITSNVKAQKQVSLVTDSFKVSGNCESCKLRIEKAAKVVGVKDALWNKDTHMFYVIYNPDKVKLEEIQSKIVAAGHDTEKQKADDKAYNKLPACCKYR